MDCRSLDRILFGIGKLFTRTERIVAEGRAAHVAERQIQDSCGSVWSIAVVGRWMVDGSMGGLTDGG